MSKSMVLELLTPTRPRETQAHVGGPTPYELICAAGEECEKAEDAEFLGFANIAASCRRTAEDLIDQADRLRGLHLEPGYLPCRLDAAATASPIA